MEIWLIQVLGNFVPPTLYQSSAEHWAADATLYTTDVRKASRLGDSAIYCI